MKSFRSVFHDLETVEKEFDQTLEKVLSEDTDFEKNLKAQLRDVEELKRAVNEAMQVMDEIESLTQKAESHVAASEENLEKEKANKIVGTDFNELKGDITLLKDKVQDIIQGLEKLKRDAKEEQGEVNTFSDIENQMSNALDALVEAEKDLEGAYN